MQGAGLEQKFDLTSSRERIRSLALALYRVTDKIPEAEPLRAKLRKETLVFVSTVEKVSNGNMKKYPEFLSTVRTLAHYCDIARQQSWVAEENFAVLKNEFLNTQSLFEVELSEFDGMSELSHVAFNDRGPADGARMSSSQHTVRTPGEGSADSLALARPATQDSMPARAPRGYEENIPAPLGSSGSGRFSLEKSDRGSREEALEPLVTTDDLNSRQKALLDFMVQNKTARIGDLEKLEPNVTQRTLRRDMEKLAKMGYVRKIGRTNRTLYKLVRTEDKNIEY